jgi:hypothetical protein
MIDPARGTGTKWNAGREDRAMLESNPSARAGAEASRGASLPNDRPLLRIACFGEKAINSPKDHPLRHTGGTYVTIYGTGGESRARFPSTEVLGWRSRRRLCQMSLRDKNDIGLLQIGGLHPFIPLPTRRFPPLEALLEPAARPSHCLPSRRTEV